MIKAELKRCIRIERRWNSGRCKRAVYSLYCRCRWKWCAWCRCVGHKVGGSGPVLGRRRPAVQSRQEPLREHQAVRRESCPPAARRGRRRLRLHQRLLDRGQSSRADQPPDLQTISHDNANVTIDLRRTSDLEMIPRSRLRKANGHLIV